jgi:two-component system NarL family sensor kinase
MYGERDDPYAVISRLGQRLETALAPDDVLPVVGEALAQALRLPYVAIELSRGAAFDRVASYGHPVPDPVPLPLVYRGEAVGRLVVAQRAPGEEFSTAERQLLEDVARQVGVAAHAVRLAHDLQRSRERLVTAREEERRRLRRDLHDGLGPSLAGIALEIEAARNLLRHDPGSADELLSTLAAKANEAIAEIRRLAYGLRPPSLDELGLVRAIQEQASRFGDGGDGGGLMVSVEAPEKLEPLPAAVEVAAYRIVMEGLTNAARHSGARTCTIRLRWNDALELEVSDDGRGLPEDHRAGVGLTSMGERVSELGGSLTIAPATSGGTCVRASLPIGGR